MRHTEHYEAHEKRIVPITPKLIKLLQDRFDEVEEGESHRVQIGGKIQRVQRLNFNGDTRLPVIDIDIRFDPREAA